MRHLGQPLPRQSLHTFLTSRWARIPITEEAIKKIKADLPELPAEKRRRFIEEYAVSPDEAKVLSDSPDIADYFEQVMTEARAWLESLSEPLGTSEEIWQLNKKKLTKLVAGWLMSELFKLLNETGDSILDIKISPENFAEFIALVYERKVNSSSAQLLLRRMYETGGDPSVIMAEEDLGQVDDDGQLMEAVDKIIKANPGQVMEYKNGKTPLLKYFVGLAMKETKGKANPEKLTEIFRKKMQ